MKKNKSRLLAGIAVFLLVTAVMSTSSFASSDFYESSYNGYHYICRSTLLDRYCRSKLDCQKPTYLLDTIGVSYFTNNGTPMATYDYESSHSSVTLVFSSSNPDIHYFKSYHYYYIQLDNVYSTNLIY